MRNLFEIGVCSFFCDVLDEFGCYNGPREGGKLSPFAAGKPHACGGRSVPPRGRDGSAYPIGPEAMDAFGSSRRIVTGRAAPFPKL